MLLQRVKAERPLVPLRTPEGPGQNIHRRSTNENVNAPRKGEGAGKPAPHAFLIVSDSVSEINMSLQSVNYQSVLADLKGRRDRLNAAISAVEQIIGELESAPRQQQDSVAAPALPRSSPRLYRNKTIGDSIVHYLGLVGEPKPPADIVRALRDGGIRSKSKSLYRTAYSTMKQRAKRTDSDIVKVGSRWGLKKWQEVTIPSPT